MVAIKLFGQQTSTYEYVKMMIGRNADLAGITLSIEEISDWEEIVKEKVLSLPTVRVNDRNSFTLGEDRDVNAFINEVTHNILKEENYGVMKKILVPTDFSDTATNALVYARGISSQLNSVIQLVHVYKPEVAPVEGVVIIDEHIEQAKRKQLSDFVGKINQSWTAASDTALPIDGVFKVGLVVDALEEMSDDQEKEYLIIAGSTGESGIFKKLFGSVTTQLAKTCKSPVLIVPHGATYNKITDILYTVDNIEIDLRALPKVLDFASIFGAAVHFVHVKDEDRYPSKELITIALSTHPDLIVSFDTIVGEDVSKAIDEYATQHSVDIIAMSTRERGFFADLFHRSITKNMTISTTIPLLILHS